MSKILVATILCLFLNAMFKIYKTLLFTSFVLLFSVVYLSIGIVSQLNNYKADKEEIADVLNFENRLMDAQEYIPFFSNTDSKINKWDVLNKSATKSYRKALMLGYVLGLVVFVYILINYFVYNEFDKYRVLGITFIFGSLSFLYLGLQNPFLEIEAYSKDLKITANLISIDKTFEGRTYFLYQNKSVFQLIKLLFSGGNILVGLCLVLFSIVFPLVKLTASLLVLITPNTNTSKKSVSVINKLGKWSMADVFVSAVFLAVFSFTNMNDGVDTSSSTLIGLYFFLTFVILSITSGVFLKKVVELN
jgi:hypothetical protein